MLCKYINYLKNITQFYSTFEVWTCTFGVSTVQYDEVFYLQRSHFDIYVGSFYLHRSYGWYHIINYGP